MVGKGNFCDSIPIARDMGYSTIQATVITILLRTLFASLAVFQVSEEGLLFREKGREGNRE